MDEGLKGLGKSHGRLGESYEDGHELNGLDEQLGESDEDCIGLGEWHGDSTSWQVRHGTRRVAEGTRRVEVNMDC